MDRTLPYSVPAWALENQKRFLSAPSLATSAMPALPAWALEKQTTERDAMFGAAFTQEVTAAVAMGLVSTESSGGIFPPPGPPPASYFRDVRNHPDVLATIINTARVTAGYLPESGLSAREQHEAFQRFVAELDRYHAYIILLNSQSTLIENKEITCNTLLSIIADVITGALGDDDNSQGLVDKIKNMITRAADYVTQGHSSNSYADTSYELVGLPAPQDQADKDVDPISAICLSVVRMSRSVTPGKNGGTASSQEFAVASHRYRLMSSAIIAYADHLEGSQITRVEELARQLNAQASL